MKVGRLALAAAALAACAAAADETWIEAEDFGDKGNWAVDTQYTHLMGSAYLLAPGVLKPIGTAKGTFSVRRAGRHAVWARTRDWVPAHHPGRFDASVDGRRLPATLGASGRTGWTWEKAGEADLGGGTHEIALEDLTGAFARCDAILVTDDLAFAPPDDAAATERLRARLAPPPPPADGGTYDVVVVGAGPAGLCAAVAAARNGARTALVHDRPVLGGNCSDEIRVATDGAANFRPNMRESGIVEEWNLLDPHGRGRGLSDAARILADGEPNLKTFLNERVTAAEAADGRIAAVTARNTLTGARTRFAGRIFVDATGDGWVGFYAGADYRFGREAQAEFNEPKSQTPAKADRLTMSGCLCEYRFELRDHPVPYVAPAWADVLPEGFDRRPANLAMPWWLEHPNDLDDLAQGEEARDELLRYNFAYWGWLKNKSRLKGKAAHAELTFMPWVNGRRESRRLVGDVILTGNDLIAGSNFADRVAYGGWGLDVHDVLGMKRPVGNGWDGEQIGVPTYSIPFRALYSRNVSNLLMAGRCLSATHLALGSARVGATCAVQGQAAGTAAALCAKEGLTPRELGRTRIRDLQQTLLKDDQFIPALANEDPLDKARRATATASSSAPEFAFRPPRWWRCPSSWPDAPNGMKKALGASPQGVVDGVSRVVGTNAHAWASSGPMPQWIQLDLPAPEMISEVRVTFDSDLSTYCAEHYAGALARDYAVEILSDGVWRKVADETGNVRRLRVHRFAPAKAAAVRVTVSATHGAPSVHVFEIRIY